MKVFLSPLAEHKIALLLDYLESNWSAKSRTDFLTKLSKSFNQISNQPRSYPESTEFPNLYKCVVTKQTSYFYRITAEEIEVITLIDNRQDPDEIAEELKHWR